jgi:hypothetical protein
LDFFDAESGSTEANLSDLSGCKPYSALHFCSRGQLTQAIAVSMTGCLASILGVFAGGAEGPSDLLSHSMEPQNWIKNMKFLESEN